jgi:2-dehydropantoate 2-reductase
VLPKHVALLLLQNGIGGHEQLARAFPNNPIYLGTTTDAVQRVTPDQYKVHARGELLVGSETLLQPCPAISRLISLHPKGSWVTNIMDYLYKKLAVNAVINPLTAIHACSNGEIKAYPDDIAALKKEIHTLYAALDLGLELDKLDSYIDSVIELTHSNYSSMYQDVRNQKPTEIEGILGALQKKAAQLEIAVPTINHLYQKVRALEQTYS